MAPMRTAVAVIILATTSAATFVQPRPTSSAAYLPARPSIGARRRCGPPSLFLPPKERLSSEEVQALAGVWRADLDLDDGAQTLSLHLDAQGGVHPAERSLPFNICNGEHGWSSARWECRAVRESSTVHLKLQLGVLYLEGTGERDGLRCKTLKGSVCEGGDDPCYVGSFELSLVLPTSNDVAVLQERHQARVDARPAPPLAFKLESFVGRWRMLVSLDGDSFRELLALSRE